MHCSLLRSAALRRQSTWRRTGASLICTGHCVSSEPISPAVCSSTLLSASASLRMLSPGFPDIRMVSLPPLCSFYVLPLPSHHKLLPHAPQNGSHLRTGRQTVAETVTIIIAHSFAFPFTIAIAPHDHASAQRPHPTHASSSISIILLTIFHSSCCLHIYYLFHLTFYVHTNIIKKIFSVVFTTLIMFYSTNIG